MKPGIDEIGQDEINNAVLSAEGHCGLGALLGKRVKTRAFSPGQNE